MCKILGVAVPLLRKRAILLSAVLLGVLSALSYAQTLRSKADSHYLPAGVNQLAKLSATGTVGFGCGVAMSDDTIVAVDSLEEVYVFVKPTTGWADMTPTATLTPSDHPSGGCSSGSGGPSVTISGSTVVLGTPWASAGSDQYQGAAYVFVKPAGGWTDMTETAKLTASDGIVGSNLGWSVAINQAGNTIVAGAPAMSLFGGTGPGAAYLFLEPSTGWVSMNESGKMMASDRSAGDQFGVSAALGNNGVAIGATNAVTACGSGAWYMFAKPTKVLSQIVTQTAKLSPCGGGFISGFNGEAVAMGANTVVGGGLDVAFVFEEPENGWADMNQTAILMDPALPAWMGSSVSISGNRVVSGAFGANQQQGLADAFVKPAGGWAGTVNQTAQFGASGGQANDYFGTSVAINGSTVVAGAPFADGEAGAVYVFGPK